MKIVNDLPIGPILPYASLQVKSGVAVPVKDVDDRISALRTAAKASDAAARAEGAKTAADRRGGSLWSLPAELGDLDDDGVLETGR